MFYVWQYGDCLKKVAEKFRTTPEKIINMNQLSNSDYIQVGDIIRVK
jgi:LysM repeat protein